MVTRTFPLISVLIGRVRVRLASESLHAAAFNFLPSLSNNPGYKKILINTGRYGAHSHKEVIK